MYRNLFLIVIMAAFMISCGGNKQEESTTSEEAAYEAPVKVSVADFDQQAGDLVGEMIVIYGTVDHICQHGGKRMFIIDQGTDKTREDCSCRRYGKLQYRPGRKQCCC
ncbi:MAG: hypothetical protein U5Q03_14000 [Bacteroidota bacterium]|nr:hypothetical protein [Bacteroidota bacterium]